MRFSWAVEEIAYRHPCDASHCAPVVIAAGDEGDLADGVVTIVAAAPFVRRIRIVPDAGEDPRPPRRRLTRER